LDEPTRSKALVTISLVLGLSRETLKNLPKTSLLFPSPQGR
jgi:hypothetical protein